jgi:hypothetical protein
MKQVCIRRLSWHRESPVGPLVHEPRRQVSTSGDWRALTFDSSREPWIDFDRCESARSGGNRNPVPVGVLDIEPLRFQTHDGWLRVENTLRVTAMPMVVGVLMLRGRDGGNKHGGRSV